MSWAHYLLQVNIYLIVFFCFYKLLLDRETYFNLNRAYLIGSGILSLAIPFLRFEWLTTQPVSKPVYNGVDQLSGFVAQVSIMPVHTTEQFNWGNLVVAIYVCGILFCIGRFIYRLIALRKILHIAKNGVAFSFFNRKVIAADVPEPATVDMHEEIHIRQKHSLDIIFFECLGIFTWFNPITYAYKNAIKNIHEFLADEAAANFQGDKEAYSLLLLSKAFGASPSDLTNGFFTRSLVKRRIFMLYKQRSKKTAILKYGLFVPLFALTLILSSATVRKNNSLLRVAENIPLNEVSNAVTQTLETPLRMVNVVMADEAENRTTVKEQVKLTAPASKIWNGFYHYLGKKITFPKETITNRMPANVRINFNIETGKINNVRVVGNLGYGMQQEIKENVISFNKAIPAEDGNYSLVTSFKPNALINRPENIVSVAPDGYNELPEIIITAATTSPQPEEEKTYNAINVNQPPTYPGGISKFYDFLSQTIKYPNEASERSVQGTIYTSFTIEKNGRLTDIAINGRKLGYGMEEEAIRVLKLSRPWNPGIHNGQIVRVRYNIPIKFSMPVEIVNVKAMPIITRTQLNNTIKTLIRGANIPPTDNIMYVIDGEIQDKEALNRLKPERIESITILKDAAAVLEYGEAAEKGVIILSTKNKPAHTSY